MRLAILLKSLLCQIFGDGENIFKITASYECLNPDVEVVLAFLVRDTDP